MGDIPASILFTCCQLVVGVPGLLVEGRNFAKLSLFDTDLVLGLPPRGVALVVFSDLPPVASFFDLAAPLSLTFSFAGGVQLIPESMKW